MTWNDIKRSTEVPYWCRPENRMRRDNPLFVTVEKLIGNKTMTRDQMRNEISDRFKHYPPKNENEIFVHEEIRQICRDTAHKLVSILPESVINTREFSQVLTDLENAMMHANAAYARHKND